MTQTIGDTLGRGDTAVGAPLHCGEPMTLRETSYRGSSYGLLPQPVAAFDVELVWACSCGFQLSHEEPAELALPLSPALRRVAAAAADLESVQWHLDQLTTELESAVLRAADAGAAITDIAEAAHLEPCEVRQLASGSHLLVDVG
ncbi:hypothetical protein FDK12_05935 [Arthrobacter sp. NamB2]|uniref:hypothetical protein n=1 Tax=Arthrobacter sp. NamB2 TaxID=2576035 RepID=UPI0010CA1FB9|nr:hypothetical protein [Arthrobacter sp. NamB2]TKV29179.1 hypothetical protein FDK12_05935 [Arthrobacter sp. NamB2]